MQRAVLCCAQDRDAAERGGSGVTCHYFNTFFLNKLYVDEGEYIYKNVSVAARVVC